MGVETVDFGRQNKLQHTGLLRGGLIIEIQIKVIGGDEEKRIRGKHYMYTFPGPIGRWSLWLISDRDPSWWVVKHRNPPPFNRSFNVIEIMLGVISYWILLDLSLRNAWGVGVRCFHEHWPEYIVTMAIDNVPLTEPLEYLMHVTFLMDLIRSSFIFIIWARVRRTIYIILYPSPWMR